MKKNFLIVFVFSLLIGCFVFADSDSDDMVTLSFNPVSTSIVESEDSVDVCVELSEPLSAALPLSVSWEVVGGTATKGTDYSTSGGNLLVFETGETTECFMVLIHDDSEIETNETAKFAIDISSVSNSSVRIKNSQFLLTIANNDMTGSGNSENSSNVEIMPEFSFVYPTQGAKMGGRVLIKGDVENAISVELYYRLPQSPTPIYLGNCFSTDGNIWQYFWNTPLSPNGHYELFSKIINQHGEYYSSPMEIEIENVAKATEEEQVLIEKVEQGRIEIARREEDITAKKITIEEKLIRETESFAREIKIVLGKELEGVLGQEVEKRLEEFRTGTEGRIEEIVESAKRGERLKREIELKRQRKNVIMSEIESVQSELVKIRNMKIETPDEKRRDKIEILENIMKERLENKEIELQEVGKKLNSLKRELIEIEEEREEFKRGIVNESIKVIEPTKETALESQKLLILEAEREVEKKIESHLKDLEVNVSEIESSKIERTQILMEDSDGDGLSNKEEERLGTSLSNPDSDGDGFLDGTEYASGFDPLDPSPADKIIYEDPRKIRSIKADTYKVERVESIKLSTGETSIKVEGKGLPNSFVTIHIFSQAIVMTTRTDASGNWSIVLNKPLTDETHEVYATITDNQGKITARSDPFVFTKVGEKIAAITLAEISSGGTASIVDALQRVFLFSVIGIITLALGIALIGISFISRRKDKKKK